MTQSAQSIGPMIDWHQLYNQLPTGVVIIDGYGLVEACNQSAISFLGEQIVGQKWLEVIRNNFAPQADDGHEMSLIDGRRLNVRIQSLQHRPGEMIVLTDITLTRTFEQERARMMRLQEIGEMLAHLAHQIRTPLASAMLYLKNLQHPNISEEKQNNFIEKISYCHQNIAQQIQDLLFFAKGGESVLQVINLGTLISEVERKSEVKISQTEAELLIENQAGDLSFLCHIESLEGALSNLVDNALNANAKKVYINIINQDNETIIFNVIDNGDGMDDITLNKVLMPFYTTRAKGTGLGLAVVDAVAKAHHGEVKVLSKEGIGSTFSIQMPLLKQDEKG